MKAGDDWYVFDHTPIPPAPDYATEKAPNGCTTGMMRNRYVAMLLLPSLSHAPPFVKREP